MSSEEQKIRWSVSIMTVNKRIPFYRTHFPQSTEGYIARVSAMVVFNYINFPDVLNPPEPLIHTEFEPKCCSAILVISSLYPHYQ